MATWQGNNHGNYQTVLTVNQTSQNINNNTTTVSVSLAVKKLSGSGYWSGYSSNWSINIGGQTRNGTFTYDFRNYSSLTLWSGSLTITHENDGSKSLTCSSSVSLDNLGTANPSGTMQLTTIPRASSLQGLPASFVIGTSIPFTIKTASSAFRHTVYLRKPSENLNITAVTNLTTGGTLAPTVANQDVIYKMIPKATSIALGIRINTYNGNNLIGFKDYTITANVGPAIVPTFSTLTHSENVAAVKNAVGVYVQNMSKLNMAITGAAGVKYSTITNYKIEVDNQVLNAATGVTQTIQSKGSLTARATITDSRGRTATKTITLSVLPYEFPKLNKAPTFVRCDSAGKENPIGTYVKVAINAGVTSLKVNNVEKNKIKYIIQSQQRGTTAWTDKINKQLATITYNGNTIVATYSIDYAFNFQIKIQDIFNTTISIGLVPNGKITMQWGNDWAAIGKTYDGKGSIDTAGQIYQNDGKPVVGLDKAGTSYFGLTQEHGVDTNWIRTTVNGMIPYSQTASSSIGTTSWQFKNVYARSIYMDNKILATQEELASRTKKWVTIYTNNAGINLTSARTWNIPANFTSLRLTLCDAPIQEFDFSIGKKVKNSYSLTSWVMDGFPRFQIDASVSGKITFRWTSGGSSEWILISKVEYAI